MVYIENWEDFQERAIVLFRSDPVAVSLPSFPSCYSVLNFCARWINASEPSERVLWKLRDEVLCLTSSMTCAWFLH